MLSSIVGYRSYGVQFEKDCEDERCYVVYWDDKDVKKICIGCESLDRAVPLPELLPLSKVVGSLSTSQLPISILGASPSLIRVLDDNRADGRRFVIYQTFDEETLLQRVLQADKDVLGMVSIVTLVEYLIHCLKSALYEEWTEDKIVLRKCIRQGSVEFADYRQFLSDVIDLWPILRPFVRCTGHPEAKEKADTVSCFFLFVTSVVSFLPSPSPFFVVVVVAFLCLLLASGMVDVCF